MVQFTSRMLSLSRTSKARTRRSACKPRLEVLEDRRLPAITSFAQFLQVDPSAQNFTYENADPLFNTVAGGDAVIVTFDSSIVTGLGTGPVAAHLFLNSFTNSQVVLGTDGVLRESFPDPTNTMRIVLDTPVGGKSNFLTVTFNAILSGAPGGTSGNLRASDRATLPFTVSYTSDFVDFTNSVAHSFALSFTSITSVGGGGLQVDRNGFFQAFTAAGTGTFDTDFSPPGTVSGRKFLDRNGNGRLDSDEPGFGGVTLFLDANNNGRLDSGEPSTVSVTSSDPAVNGTFTFTNVPPGSYVLREIPVPLFQQSTPSLSIVVTSGATISGLLIGNTAITSPQPPLIPLSSQLSATVSPTLLSKLELFGLNVTAMTSGLLAADANFVGGVYQNLLGRHPEDAALVTDLQLLLAGVPRQVIVDSVARSPERRTFEVDQYYVNLLGRAADPAGQAAWTNLMLAGATENDVIRGLLTSAEFNAAHPTDDAFVNSLYNLILGRNGGATEQAAWLQALQNGVTRAQVVQSFLASAEANQRAVNEYYAVFLNRAPSGAEQQAYVGLLLGGQLNYTTIAEAILASDEYFARTSSL